MARAILLAKKEAVERQQAQDKQMRRYSKETAVVDKLYKSLRDLDSSVALNMISDPNLVKTIKTLVTRDKQAGAMAHSRCIYALHALLFALIDYDCSEVLNRMSDNNIKMLKETILIVKDYEKIPLKTIENYLDDHLKNKSRTKLEKAECGIITTSLRIYKMVVENWDDAIETLQKYSDAIDVFERAPIAETEELPEVALEQTTQESGKQELWSMKELAEHLGIPYSTLRSKMSSRIMPHLSDFEKQEVKGWFIVMEHEVGHPKMFVAQYFANFQALFDRFNSKKSKKKSAEKKTTETKVAKQKRAKAKVETHTETKADKKAEKKADLTELKALEMFLKKLEELKTEYEKAKKDLAEAQKSYASIAEKAFTETDPATCAELLRQATEANAKVLKAKQECDKKSAKFNDADKLLQTRITALDALRKANDDIAKFMAKDTENVK